MTHAALARKSEVAPLRGKAPARGPAADLKVSAPDDAFEQEADRAADAVMADGGSGARWSITTTGITAPLQRACACGGSSSSEGDCEECKAKARGLQRQRDGNAASGPSIAPSIVHEVLRAPGQPLSPGIRRSFERSLGYDLSTVRVHTDQRAAQSARAVSARAYTVGRDVVFGPGRYQPETDAGRRLLAHELTHVVQQRFAEPAPPGPLELGSPGEASEQEAARIAPRTLERGSMGSPPGATTVPRPKVMRDFDSTMRICQRLLKSRTFHVDTGTVTAKLEGSWTAADPSELQPGDPGPNCSTDPYYYVTLTRERTLLDKEVSTHPVPFGHSVSRTWTGLESADYHLTIWTNNTNPNCCLEGTVSVSTAAATGAASPTAATTLPATACFDGDKIYVSKGGRSFSCPALTGTVGDPTPPGLYCIRRQGEAIVSGGIKGRLFQDRPSWLLLEPQFATKRFKMILHPGVMSSGCITVMDRSCFDQLASILNSGGTTSATGYDGYPPGNASGTEVPAHSVDCVGTLLVTTTMGGCTGGGAKTTPPATTSAPTTTPEKVP